MITPRLSVGTTFSDNIRLAPDDEREDDMVFQVDPGISVRKQGGRLDLRLDYTAQGLLYANNGDASTINNNLLTFGTAELAENSLFLDISGSISQVPTTSSGRVDAGNLSSSDGSSTGGSTLLGFFNSMDLGLPNAQELFSPVGIFSNIALTDNQTTQSSFGISPYWRQRFGGWAEALLRYRYSDVSYNESNGQSDSESEALDSRLSSIEFNLTSGRQFNPLTWNLNYSYERQDGQQSSDTQESGDSREERVAGELSYRLNKNWALAGEAGYSNNQSSTYSDYENGLYWGLGATWTPNRFYSLTGLYGLNFNKVVLQWNPTPQTSPQASSQASLQASPQVSLPTTPPRTSLQISRTDQGVGYSPGVYWNGSFSHRTPYSTWSATYTQEVTTSQQLAVVGVGPNGEPLPLDEEGQTLISSGGFGLTNQQFLRKSFNVAVTYRRGRSSLGFSAFGESREFEDATLNEDTYGTGAIWAWRFAPRTASFLGTGWEHDVLQDDQQNDYWVSVIGLARVFTPDSGGLISYRYYQNDGDPDSESFRENRLNIRFNMKF